MYSKIKTELVSMWFCVSLQMRNCGVAKLRYCVKPQWDVLEFEVFKLCVFILADKGNQEINSRINVDSLL